MFRVCCIFLIYGIISLYWNFWWNKLMPIVLHATSFYWIHLQFTSPNTLIYIRIKCLILQLPTYNFIGEICCLSKKQHKRCLRKDWGYMVNKLVYINAKNTWVFFIKLKLDFCMWCVTVAFPMHSKECYKGKNRRQRCMY